MGKYHILFKRANGVQDEKGKFYPFQMVSGGTALAAKPNVRYYIESVHITLEGVAGDAGTDAYVTGIVEGVTTYLGRLKRVNATTSFLSQYFPVGLFLDKGTATVVTTTNITAVSVSTKYAEIVEVEGEYSA